MARKYFGTDGMRGEANKDLTIDLVTNLGLALGYYLKKHRKKAGKPRIILGTDTRISGYMIRSALSAGLNSMGVHIDFVGVLPTPGVCYLTRKLKADAGIMISASHNPVKDNGIKIFSSNGYKLPDKVEEELESLMENREKLLEHQVSGDDLGRFKYVEDDMRIYLDFLASTVKTNFKGLKIVIDAANGAAYRVASKIYQKLGAEIIVINNIPNGKNINVNCGSTHPELLQEVVKVYKADLGLAFDGDADRLIAVDHEGNVINGDLVIAIIAGLVRSIISYYTMNEEQRVQAALKVISEELMKMMVQAEIQWKDYKKSGELKRSQVIKDIYNQFPFLSRYMDQEKLVQTIYEMIDKQMDNMNELMKKNEVQ